MGMTGDVDDFDDYDDCNDNDDDIGICLSKAFPLFSLHITFYDIIQFWVGNHSL